MPSMPPKNGWAAYKLERRHAARLLGKCGKCYLRKAERKRTTCRECREANTRTERLRRARVAA